jgi:crossover junction endodeoxyribonuclease RuvC
MKILSIDPGYERVGIAIIEKNLGQKEVLIYSDCFKTSIELPFHLRLNLIGQEIAKVIKEHSPEVLAIETLFFNNNQKTAMKVSEARGAIIYQSVSLGLDLFEYAPLQIKIAVTGYGRSDKKQIIHMIPHLIQINKDIKYDDEYDAIAIGLTYFAHNNNK